MTETTTAPITCLIRYRLSSEGRKDALRQGHAANEAQDRQLKIPTEDLAWADVCADGSCVATVHTYRITSYDTVEEKPCALDLYPTDEQLLSLCRGMSEAKAKAVASCDEQVAKKRAQEVADEQRLEAKGAKLARAFLEDPQARSHFSTSAGKACIYLHGYPFLSTTDVYREALRRQEADDELARQQQAMASAELATFLDEHTDHNTRERYHAGVLPGEELRTIITDVVFQVLDSGFPRYMPLTEDEIQHDHEYCGSDSRIISSTVPLETLTAVQWKRLKEIMAVAPDRATITYRQHQLSCKWCNAHVTQEGILVECERYGLTLTREYAG